MRIILLLILLLSSIAKAEIYKEAQTCEKTNEICFHWWPVLPNIEGWSQDLKSSYSYSSNAQTPIGSSFAEAETVIYAKAIYKQQQPESKNLDSFIKNDQSGFIQNDPQIKIKEIEQITTLSGKKCRRFAFAPSSKGSWEQVAYTEESDKDKNEYFLIFVISSRTESGLKNNIKAYEQFITNYN